MYADIIVDISHEQLDKTFQYSIPQELETEIQIGIQVNVPFGRANRIITGYVIEIGEIPKFDKDKTKPIDSVVPGKVRTAGRLIQLAAWIKKNYGSTMNQALKTVIPVKDTVKTKEKVTVHLAVERDEALELLSEYKRKGFSAKVRLMETLMETGDADYGLFTGKLKIPPQTIRTFENQGIIELSSEEYYRNPINLESEEEVKNELNALQVSIVNSIQEDYDSGIKNTYLIHGITGSGKTEIYMKLIEHVIAQGKQVIMLIPEISLTFQTVNRFFKRFGDAVSIMNSRLSKGERFDQFMRAVKGEISIIIGPRSALFTPFENIGLIVIDEEHEGAYKSETSPQYHARETAIHIAENCGASVILGSATPSLESYYNAIQGRYKLFTLNERAADSHLPKVYISDLREELKNGNRTIFSEKLQVLMQDRLNKKQQIMLFLNKRGYAGFISCRSCGHVMKCPHCDISLTSHNNGRLVCHYCGFEQRMVSTCPECGSKYISGFRAGTQQVEEMVKHMYPDAAVLRMDMDTTSGKGGHEKILESFTNREADILIGTQMIVKGHDFHNVTLVGILAADMSLYAADFRASERTFQLLTQASGRAGRGDIPGEVVIQTYTPEHYSIVTAAQQDYLQFFHQELTYRQMLNYPPISNMLMIRISSKGEAELAKAAEILASKEKDFVDTVLNLLPVFNTMVQDNSGVVPMQVIGPANASLYKANDVFHKVIYIKCVDYEILTVYKEQVENFARDNVDFRKINLQFDFNPLTM